MNQKLHAYIEQRTCAFIVTKDPQVAQGEQPNEVPPTTTLKRHEGWKAWLLCFGPCLLGKARVSDKDFDGSKDASKEAAVSILKRVHLEMQSLEVCTLPELKKKCTEMNVSKVGTKACLIVKLLESVANAKASQKDEEGEKTSEKNVEEGPALKIDELGNHLGSKRRRLCSKSSILEAGSKGWKFEDYCERDVTNFFTEGFSVEADSKEKTQQELLQNNPHGIVPSVAIDKFRMGHAALKGDAVGILFGETVATGGRKNNTERRWMKRLLMGTCIQMTDQVVSEACCMKREFYARGNASH